MQGPECVIDRGLARQDAQDLFSAGEGKWGTDESTFLRIIAIRHFYQLRATFDEYAQVFNLILTVPFLSGLMINSRKLDWYGYLI